MGIFMSRQSDEFKPLADLMHDLKSSIEKDAFILADLENQNTKHINALGHNAAGLESKEIEQLAMHALEKNKMDAFNLIAQNQFQEMAENLQVAKLKKEIETGNAPDLKQDFSCKVSNSVTEERTGYMSASQDQGDMHTKTEIVGSSFSLSDQNKVALVNHALLQNKSDIAKQLVVQLPNDQLNKFSTHAVLGSTVKEEKKKRQKEAQKQGLLGTLDALAEKIKTLQKEYEGRNSLFFWNSANKEKITEAGEMLTEITRLKDLLNNTTNNNDPWTLVETKTALSDKKTLHGYARNLGELQGGVVSFLSSAPSAAPTLSS